MLSNIGFPTLILIIVLALLLFGPNKLPELGRAFGKTLREFKKGAKDLMDEEEEDNRKRKDVSPESRSASLPEETKERDDRRLPE